MPLLKLRSGYGTAKSLAPTRVHNFVRTTLPKYLAGYGPEGVGLGETYDVYLRLIGKRVVDFVLVLIELFSLGVMAEALLANID